MLLGDLASVSGLEAGTSDGEDNPFILGKGTFAQPSAGLCGYSHGKEKHLSVVFFFFATTEFHFEPLTPWAFSQAERVESTGAQGGRRWGGG